MRQTVRRLRLVTYLVLGLTFCAATARAQEAASITGQIKDNSGGVLPGVTVTATSPVLQVGAISGVSDANGEYRLAPLPVGLYDVSYTLQGFTTLKRTEIRLSSGFVAKIDIVMSVGALNETITVTGQAPLVDVTSTTTSTQLTREVLEQIPTARVGVSSLLLTAPGVRALLDVGGSTALSVPAFRAFGQVGESWQSLEGVTSVQARPSSNAGFGNYFDFAVVEEGNIKTTGANADMPFRGIQLEQIVKSGGNQFHGSVYHTWSNHSLVSSNITPELQAVGIRESPTLNVRRDTTGDIGGRVVRDKVWFYWGSTQNLRNANALDCYQDDKTTPCFGRQRGTYHTGKLSYQMLQSTRFVGFAQFGRKQNLSPGSATVPWETRYEQDHNMFTGKLEMQNVFGQSLVTSVQSGRFSYEGPYHNYSGKTSTLETTTGVLSGTKFGGLQTGVDRGAYQWHHRATMTLYKPGLLYGNHEFKAGADAVLFDLNITGVPLNIKNPAAGIDFPSHDYQLQFTNGVPTQMIIRNSFVDPHTYSRWVGSYVQDNWVIGRRVTINLGLRFAHDNAFVPEQCREAGSEFPTLFPAACYDKVQFMVHNDFAPRVHFAWDIGGNGLTVAKGGWSRFVERRSVEPELVSANANERQEWLFRWRDLNGNREYDAGEVILDKNGADYISVSPVANGKPNLTDEKAPKSDEFMVSLERQLMTNTAIRVTGIYSRNIDAKALSNQLRPYSVYNIPITNRDPGKDGVLNTADDPGTTVTYFDYPTVYRGANFDQSYTINVPALDSTYTSYELALSRRLANRFMFQASFSSTKVDNPSPSKVPVYIPNNFINVADTGTEWTGKLSGAYQLPATVTVSANYEVRSGDYYARTAVFRGGVSVPQVTLNVEPRNSNQLPTFSHLDLRADKRFRLPNGQSFSVRMNVYNALNSSTTTGVNNRSGATFGRPTSILDSRVADIGGTFSF